MPGSKSDTTKPAGKPSAFVDTRVIYCGDNLEQLKKLPDTCVDLVYWTRRSTLIAGVLRWLRLLARLVDGDRWFLPPGAYWSPTMPSVASIR
jgi:hypothetical protein